MSHRTDKSWRNQPSMSPYGPQYPPKDYPGGRGDYGPPRDYPHSRDLSPSEQFHSPPQHGGGYPNGRQQESRHSATATSTISTSSSDDDSEQPHHQVPPPGAGHPAAYGYGGYHPGYPPSQAPYPASVAGGYPGGTMKSAKSVPALVAPTYDGEPCPVHHGPMPPPGMPGPPMSMPPMVHPGYATMGPPRRAASIYDMRMMSPPPTIYGTLPHPVGPADARSIAGSTVLGPAAPGAPLGIPPQLLPPMARPRPLVIGEGGTAEVLPVRSNKDKDGALPKALLAAKGGAGDPVDPKSKGPFCCKGGKVVFVAILSVIVLGIIATLMLLFIP